MYVRTYTVRCLILYLCSCFVSVYVSLSLSLSIYPYSPCSLLFSPLSPVALAFSRSISVYISAPLSLSLYLGNVPIDTLLSKPCPRNLWYPGPPHHPPTTPAPSQAKTKPMRPRILGPPTATPPWFLPSVGDGISVSLL